MPDAKLCVACFEGIHLRATRCPHCGSEQAPSPWAPVATALRWAGGATAVLSLLFAVVQLEALVSGWSAQQQLLLELREAARLQVEAGDFAGAGETLRGGAAGSHAVSSAPPELVALELHAALSELRDARAVGTEGYAPTVERLQPVLRRAVGRLDGRERADVLAHLGWSSFLLFYDGRGDGNVDAYHAKALEAEPANVYAHAWLAHWILWPGGAHRFAPAEQRVEQANVHFRAALESGREREWVRRIQINSWLNGNSIGWYAELARAANAARVSGDTLSARSRDRVVRAYTRALSSARSREELLAALPLAQQVDTLVWLGADGETDLTRDPRQLGTLEQLLVALADAERARSAREQLSPHLDEALRSSFDEALRRIGEG
jgi:hypothetical protein